MTFSLLYNYTSKLDVYRASFYFVLNYTSRLVWFFFRNTYLFITFNPIIIPLWFCVVSALVNNCIVQLPNVYIPVLPRAQNVKAQSRLFWTFMNGTSGARYCRWPCQTHWLITYLVIHTLSYPHLSVTYFVPDCTFYIKNIDIGSCS